MTKEEIKKALMTCSVDSCKDCPYDNTGLYCCGKLKRDALDLITEQEKEIERQNGRIRALNNRLNEKYALISNMEQKIDALKDDFESLQKDYEFVRDCDAEHCLELNRLNELGASVFE